MLKRGLDDAANLRKNLERRPAHRLRVLVRAHHRQKAVVVEHDELGSPIERNNRGVPLSQVGRRKPPEGEAISAIRRSAKSIRVHAYFSVAVLHVWRLATQATL